MLQLELIKLDGMPYQIVYKGSTLTQYNSVSKKRCIEWAADNFKGVPLYCNGKLINKHVEA